MTSWRAGCILIAGLFVASAAAAADGGPVRPRHGARATRSPAPPAPVANGQALDSLLKGSPDQQAAERSDNERAGLKPVDHRKDEFFSDWRGLR